MIARTLAIALVCAAAVMPRPVPAQVPPPNGAGVAMGHLHYHVRDVAANRRFWLALGGTSVGKAGADVVAFPGVLIVLTPRDASGGSEGAVLNHVAFRVRTFAQVEKAGLAVQRLAQFPGVGTTMTPEGERIELFEDAATNLGFTPDTGVLDAVADRHNHPLTTAVAFHHVHLYLPGDAHLDAKAWYARLFGGVAGKRAQYDAVDLPGINFNFSGGRTGAPMKGRMLDHIGFEVADLAGFARRLAAMGVRVDEPYHAGPDGVAVVRLTDPWGTSIELTEGLAARPRTPWGDPDLQGTYTNTYENGTPLERPDSFAGRRLADVTGEELRALKRMIQQNTIARFLGPEHAPDNWWQDNLSLERGSQAWLVVDPEDGKIPPLTADAQNRNAARLAAQKASGRGPADSYTDRSLYDRCITRGLPGSMMPAIYGNQYEIVQSPGWVAIRYEMIHETRVIPLDRRPRLGGAIQQDMGDARGWWEGDTLVVETTNFKERSVYRNADPARLRLVERFTRIAPDKVRWAVTVDDPATWTRPWTFALPLTADAHPVPSYECHEGNYGLRNILSAARAQEREAAR